VPRTYVKSIARKKNYSQSFAYDPTQELRNTPNLPECMSPRLNSEVLEKNNAKVFDNYEKLKDKVGLNFYK